jgi:hypothetical protein
MSALRLAAGAAKDRNGSFANAPVLSRLPPTTANPLKAHMTSPRRSRPRRMLLVPSETRSTTMPDNGGGLRSTPDCRPRKGFFHLSYGYAPPCGPALLVTQCQLQTHALQQKSCRGRDASCLAPPAQIRTCAFPAYGSHPVAPPKRNSSGALATVRLPEKRARPLP